MHVELRSGDYPLNVLAVAVHRLNMKKAVRPGKSVKSKYESGAVGRPVRFDLGRLLRSRIGNLLEAGSVGMDRTNAKLVRIMPDKRDELTVWRPDRLLFEKSVLRDSLRRADLQLN